jgi:hypothetical protein
MMRVEKVQNNHDFFAANPFTPCRSLSEIVVHRNLSRPSYLSEYLACASICCANGSLERKS